MTMAPIFALTGAPADPTKPSLDIVIYLVALLRPWAPRLRRSSFATGLGLWPGWQVQATVGLIISAPTPLDIAADSGPTQGAMYPARKHYICSQPQLATRGMRGHVPMVGAVLGNLRFTAGTPGPRFTALARAREA